MDCTDCGACCVDQNITLNLLEMCTTPAEDMDGYGRLKKVNGHCIRFDPKTRLCTKYDDRPAACRAFTPGCGRCHIMRTWADARLHHWFIEGGPFSHVRQKNSYERFGTRLTYMEDSAGNLINLSLKKAGPGEEEAVATTIAALPSNGW